MSVRFAPRGLIKKRENIMEKFYKVSESELRKLYKSKEYLTALQNGGVDNWEWEGASIRDYLEDQKVEEFDELVELDLLQAKEIK